MHRVNPLSIVSTCLSNAHFFNKTVKKQMALQVETDPSPVDTTPQAPMYVCLHAPL